MIQSGFLREEDRKALARDASSPCRVTRRANAPVLLDAGWSCYYSKSPMRFCLTTTAYAISRNGRARSRGYAHDRASPSHRSARIMVIRSLMAKCCVLTQLELWIILPADGNFRLIVEW